MPQTSIDVKSKLLILQEKRGYSYPHIMVSFCNISTFWNGDSGNANHRLLSGPTADRECN
jgi:hypothetical protein